MAIRQWRWREHPDLILLDWMMPGKSGIEVAEGLRRDPATADIAIVMLTGRNQERQRGDWLSAFAPT